MQVITRPGHSTSFWPLRNDIPLTHESVSPPARGMKRKPVKLTRSGQEVSPMSRLLSSLAVLAFLVGTATAADPAKPAPDASKAAPNVDVVLCLDVPGSMNGLIDSAKIKLWDIVNDLGKVKPTPNLRVSLYSYGHNTYPATAGWVRKEIDFTTDLDAVYKKLNALTINGGTELVARVCRDAITQQEWSKDKKALKMIFVASNEPADQDKQETLKEVSTMALEKDIMINTIYCGNVSNSEARGWEEFAKSAEGRFVSIDQNKGVATVVATPHDQKLAELSVKLNSTYVAYGKEAERKEKAENQKAQDGKAAQNSPAAAASRATSKAGGLYRNADWDAVDRLRDDPKFDISKIPEDQLCDELKKLKPEERVKFVEKKLEERKAIQKDIEELSKKRAEYIATELKKNAKQGDAAFDEAVRKTLRDQAAKKGIEVPE